MHDEHYIDYIHYKVLYGSTPTNTLLAYNLASISIDKWKVETRIPAGGRISSMFQTILQTVGSV